MVKANIALHWNPISELRDDTCHMGSHSVTCHPTQVNAPHLTPAMQAGTRLLDTPTPERRKAELTCSWFDSAPAGSRTSDFSITSPTLNHCTTKTTTQNVVLRPKGRRLTDSRPQGSDCGVKFRFIQILWSLFDHSDNHNSYIQTYCLNSHAIDRWSLAYNHKHIQLGLLRTEMGSSR